ncbi:excinuclease ABC subunit UvrA [Dactylosporangium fulvum]|uniref:UvrABC system protein A n=1 Tax=Dactylosporangium fulvum TaxID=53359 RepID=A0ABY5VLM9_9ACTN|nr:excinuclease ABC subunit UvrA [Dactylosporangium fulvum]UWP78472.1 excinuclease ABC subunit UvrA [Dactylosporangium fulvum]
MDRIRIVGARENNLRNVTVEVPKRAITVFTGVSGSGKSSLVFDTIAAEAQRQLNETFTAFARARLPKYGQPDLDSVDNLSAAIVVDQKRLGGGSRSTVGTITDISAILRLLFSRIGQPHVGHSNAFSFNDPQGMCPECEGLGRTTTLDLDAFLDRSRSLNEGALLHPDFQPSTWYFRMFAASGFFDLDKPLSQYSDEEWHNLLHARTKIPIDVQGAPMNAAYEGAVEKFNRLFIKRDTSELSERSRQTIRRFVTERVCPACDGARLNEAARDCRIDGHSIVDLSAMEATELVEVLGTFRDPVGAPMVESLIDRVGNLVTIGLGYLSLDRETATLSGGESQRIKMVRHLSSALTEMMYIFDEPSVGLHARDVARLNTLLRKLRDKGNTVLVVEHDRDVIDIADHVIDIGPRAGAHGGAVVFAGTVAELVDAPTLTGRYMRHKLPLKTGVRQGTGVMTVADAAVHNLKKVTVDVPTGVLTVVTGVAGSGKSSLVNEAFLAQHPEAIVIDQSAVGASIRSSPATYTGMMDEIRSLFAKANKVSPGLFSFNSKGACPACQGLGIIYTDLAFMDGLKSACEECEGQRFRPEVLRHKLRGRSIAEVLDMTAEEAAEFFPEPKLQPILRAMVDVGLDYLRLGQPLSTLSGGECQRVKLATELYKSGTVYVMDEPTTGLHMSDIKHLLDIIERLVSQGNSVIVIEHNLDVIKNADWIIDLGPEGGSGGGQVIFEGTPEQLLKAEHSHTAAAVRRDVAA